MDLEATDHPAARAARCLGPLCGLVTDLGFKQSDRGAGGFLASTIETADIAQTLPQDVEGSVDIMAGGGGRTATEATLTALGEFLERYSMYWPLADTRRASYTELKECDESVIDLEYAHIWRPEDLEAAGYSPVEADTDILWASSVDLHTGDRTYVPAELVSFAPVLDGERRFPSSTSGCACGSSLAQATVGALYEQIERDAIMRTWYRHESPTRLELDALPDADRTREQLTGAYTRIELLDLPTPTTCSVVAAAWLDERDRVPKFLLHAGAHHTKEGAIEAALEETAEGLIHTRYRLAGRHDAPGTAPPTATDFTSNVDYYMRPENFEAVKHLLGGDIRSAGRPPQRDDVTAREELELVLDSLATRESRTPLAVDLTPPDVRELGMSVVSAFVPELVDMALPAVPPVRHPALNEIRTERPHPFP